MRTVFLDTVGLIALWEKRDQWHAAASRAMAPLVAERAALVTATYILHECGNAAARKPYRVDVDQLRHDLLAMGRLVVPTLEDEEIAWQDYRRQAAGGAGIVDHVSFVVMRRLGITEAFTNDRHFVAAGFHVLF